MKLVRFAYATLAIGLLSSCVIGVAHADPEESSAPRGKWRYKKSVFAERPIPNTSPVQYEEDKDKVENGGVTTFNATNMEVKCRAIRSDGEGPKSASGRALFNIVFEWIPGTSNDNAERYFRATVIKGGEANATPVRNMSLPPDQRPGSAKGDTETGFAINDTLSHTEHNVSHNSFNGIRDIFENVSNPPSTVPSTLREVLLAFSSEAAAGVNSLATSTPVGPGGGDGGDDAGGGSAPQITYVEKACSAEGRTYGKVTSVTPYNP